MSIKDEWKNLSKLQKISAIGTLVGLISFAGYLIEKGFAISDYFQSNDIKYGVELVNLTDNLKKISKFGKIYYYNNGSILQMEDYKFEITDIKTLKEEDGYYYFPPGSSAKATLRLILTDSIRKYLYITGLTGEFEFKWTGRSSIANGPMFSIRKKHIDERHYLGKLGFKGDITVIVH